jgi:phytoene synthase
MNPTATPAPAIHPSPSAPPPPGPTAAPTASPRRRSNFGVAFALLPRDQRAAIRAVHAWSRAVDDSVDEEPDAIRAEATLARWRAELAALYEGSPLDPVTRRLEPHVRRFEIPRRYLEELVTGVGMDLTRTRYATFAELERYCYRVASVVGLVCLRIFGDRDERGRSYAESLGLALQLTNILRDVAGDFARGRVYLPMDEMARFGYDVDTLGRGERNGAFLALMRFQADRARRYFDAADAEVRGLGRRRYVAAEIMGRVYRRLLEKIEASGFDVLRGEVRVPRIERVWIAGTTAAGIYLGR